MAKITLDFQKQQDIDIAIGAHDEIELDFGFDAVYTGSYELTPEINGYTVPTANKRMIKDLTIKDIRTSSIDNASGGRTFTIY